MTPIGPKAHYPLKSVCYAEINKTNIYRLDQAA